MSSDEFSNLKEVFSLLKLYGFRNYCEFSPLIVRGLGYYTGMVFETFNRNTDLSGARALMGGGRYDNLTTSLGGQKKITAVGFGLGQVPLEEALKAKNITLESKANSLDFYIVVQSDSETGDAIKLAQKLRYKGKRVIIDDSIMKDKVAKLGDQIVQAVKMGAAYALVLFPQEWKKGQIVLKNLMTKEQSTVSLKKFLNNVQA